MLFVGQPHRFRSAPVAPHARGGKGSTVIGLGAQAYPKSQRSWVIGSTPLVAPPLIPGSTCPGATAAATWPAIWERCPSALGPTPALLGTRTPLPAPGEESGDGTPVPPGQHAPSGKFFIFRSGKIGRPPETGPHSNLSRNKIRLANPAFRDDSGPSLRDPYLPVGPALIVASWSP